MQSAVNSGCGRCMICTWLALVALFGHIQLSMSNDKPRLEFWRLQGSTNGLQSLPSGKRNFHSQPLSLTYRPKVIVLRCKRLPIEKLLPPFIPRNGAEQRQSHPKLDPHSERSISSPLLPCSVSEFTSSSRSSALKRASLLSWSIWNLLSGARSVINSLISRRHLSPGDSVSGFRRNVNSLARPASSMISLEVSPSGP